VITLGIDTCEARGSVAVRRNGARVSLQAHESTQDYSSWLLPAVEKSLLEAGTKLKDVNVLAVATGPGSFTGLRVGLTTVKAWSELYGMGVVGASRLEVMARTVSLSEGNGYVAASFDAQRGQIFGGLYRIGTNEGLRAVAPEMVTSAEEFISWVGEQAGRDAVRWVTLDPMLLEAAASWKVRVARGESLVVCTTELAGGVAELGEERAGRGELSDALQLDANYVRRSDAELFGKDPGSHGR